MLGGTLEKVNMFSEIMPDEKKTWQANNVTGVCGGPLLCDTYRPEIENQQSTDESTTGSESQSNQ